MSLLPQKKGKRRMPTKLLRKREKESGRTLRTCKKRLRSTNRYSLSPSRHTDRLTSLIKSSAAESPPNKTSIWLTHLRRSKGGKLTLCKRRSSWAIARIRRRLRRSKKKSRRFATRSQHSSRESIASLRL